MAQSFYTLLGSGIVKEDRSKLNENFLTIASNFSGTAFPTNSVQIGQTCYRTDLKRTYRYVEENVWQDISEEVTVPVMTGASSDTNGETGLVPTPKAGQEEKFLRGDGTWQTVATEDTKVTTTPMTTTKAYLTATNTSGESTGTLVFDPNVYLDTTIGSLVAKTVDAETVNGTTFKGTLDGNATTATTADVAIKIGTSAGAATTIGSDSQPVYLKDGVITAMSGSFGNTDTPIYMENGVIKACANAASCKVYEATKYSASISKSGTTYTVTIKFTTSSGDFKIPSAGLTYVITRSSLGSTSLSGTLTDGNVLKRLVYIDNVQVVNSSLTVPTGYHSSGYTVSYEYSSLKCSGELYFFYIIDALKENSYGFSYTQSIINTPDST